MVNFSIVIPMGGRTEFLKWCVEVLRRNSSNPAHEIIVGFDRYHLYHIEGVEPEIRNEYPAPSKEIMDYLSEHNAKGYDLGRLGDHYRVSNACVPYCSNEWLVFTHNDVYHSKGWDTDLMNFIEQGIVAENDIMALSSLPDHAQASGVEHGTFLKHFNVEPSLVANQLGFAEPDFPYSFKESIVEEFYHMHRGRDAFFKELVRSLSWVCPIIIRRSTFERAGMYSTKFTFPDTNDLYLDAILTAKGGHKIVPLSGFVYHL